jgi:hypothetical protein
MRGVTRGAFEQYKAQQPPVIGHLDEVANMDALSRHVQQASNVSQIMTGRPVDNTWLLPDHSAEARKLAPELHEEWDKLQNEHSKLAAEHVWGEVPTPEQATNPAYKLEQELRGMVRDILPVSWDLRVAASGLRPGKLPGGAMASNTRTAWISAMALDPKLVAREESGHAIRASGLFKDAEWKILVDEAAMRDWIGDMPESVRERYYEAYADRSSDGIVDAMIEEAIMHRFAKGPEAWGPPEGVIARFMARIQDLLDRIRNWLQGRGFQNASDVFDAMESGKISSRETMPAHSSRRAGEIEARMNELKPQLLDAYKQAKEGHPIDLPSAAKSQQLLWARGFTPAIRSEELAEAIQQIYGPKEAVKFTPAKAGEYPIELQMQEQRYQNMMAEGYKPTEEEAHEHSMTSAALQEALLQEQGYQQAAECLIMAGLK